jgi:hypothetical protein
LNKTRYQSQCKSGKEIVDVVSIRVFDFSVKAAIVIEDYPSQAVENISKIRQML